MKKIILSILLTAVFLAGASCSEKEGSGVGGSKPMAADYFSYTLTDDGKGIEIQGFSSKVYDEFTEKDSNGDWRRTFSVLNIPSEIEGLPVKLIYTGGNALYCRGENSTPWWDSVIIPDGVTVLSEPGSNLSPNIYTKKLILGKNVQFPNRYKFEYLEEFFVPESVTELGRYYYGTFTTAVIPDRIKEINGSVFSDCDNLKEITFPDGIKIGEYANFPIGTLSVKTQQRLRELGYKK